MIGRLSYNGSGRRVHRSQLQKLQVSFEGRLYEMGLPRLAPQRRRNRAAYFKMGGRSDLDIDDRAGA